MKHIIFKILIIFLLFFCFISVSAFSYAKMVSTNISNSVFRLHVIANSDSSDDQALKYNVRDSLLSYMNSLCSITTSKEEAINIAKAHLSDFESLAQNVVLQNGFDYDVAVVIEDTTFPTKSYGDITLPAGTYEALNVKIGSASGHNWWCVMFPPLCFVDVSSGVVPNESKEILNNSMESESYNLITSNNQKTDINLKFKLVEFFQNIKFKTALK